MKKIIIVLYTLLILSSQIYAQFDSLIFQVSAHRIWRTTYPLDDQNSDGYDDFLIYNCLDKKAKIFFGGNPPDTIPDLEIFLPGDYYTTILDVNNDDKKDIIISYVVNNDYDGIQKIYYGGSLLDSIPDVTFYLPPGHKGIGGAFVLKDYNGDGREEFVVYDAFLPYSEKHFGTYYFYNTGSVFDTIPGYILMGDSTAGRQLYPHLYSEDMNGDGKGDITLEGYYVSGHFRDFYKGNETFDLTPEVTYRNDEHIFNTEDMSLIKNVVGGINAHILARDYDGSYPYYFIKTLWNGSFPIDTIPDIGINTQNQGMMRNSVFVNDYNGDGYNDIYGLTFAGQVKLWVGGTSFTEEAVKTWYPPSVLEKIINTDVGDVDGDSIADLGLFVLDRTGTNPCKPGIFYIIKGDTSVKGDTTTGVWEDNPITPEDFYLHNPYPNPFNSQTTIEYKLKIRAFVEIKIYDTLGKEIGLLLREEKEAGKYQHIMDAEKYGLPSGIYFYQLRIGDFVDTKKMVLLK